MVGALQRNREAIAAACARHGVARLEAFGSALRSDYRSGTSDFDFLAAFEPMDSYARVEAYFGLLEDLREVLDGAVDLVIVGAVRNPYIARAIEHTKQLLYAS